MRHYLKAIIVVLCSVVGLGLGTISPVSAHPSSQPFTATKPLPSGTQIPISTEQAMRDAMRIGGARVVARMIHRVDDSVSLTHPNARWGQVNNTRSNWGGYVADQKGTLYPIVTGATADFFVQPVSGTDTATWVGVGGWNGTNIAQVGVDQKTKQAWYELYPANPVYKFNVNGQDEMYGYVAKYSAGVWEVLIEDLTTGVYYVGTFTFAPDTTTADWIVETQLTGPVPNFATVQFDTAQWYDHNLLSQYMTSASTLRHVELVSPYSGCVNPTSVGSDHESFGDQHLSSC